MMIRLLFLGALFLVFAQVLLAKWDEEPYPAVVFPGFGQVIPAAELYPYSYDRLVLHAHTTTDTLAVDLKALLAPFPEAYPEDALLAPIRKKLRNISDRLSPHQGSPEERELLHYLRQQTRQQLGEDVRRLEIALYRYRAESNGRVSLVDITDRKRLDFE